MIDILIFGFFGNSEVFDTKIGIICFACAIISYLIGSINCGVIVSKKCGGDIRNFGSKNAGTTNVLRVYGKKPAIITFSGDILKSVIASVIGRLLLGRMGAFVAGFFCIIGHAFPIFFKFKGGKGVVCLAVMCLMTSPLVFAIMLAIFLIILFGFKMVSLASVMSALIYPLVLSKINGEGIWFVFVILACILVVFLHRKNIVRIYNHTEPKISIGKKKG